MLITELLERLGKFKTINGLQNKETWRGYYVVKNISDKEIELLRKHIPFTRFQIQHFINGNDDEMRFHIEVEKPIRGKKE